MGVESMMMLIGPISRSEAFVTAPMIGKRSFAVNVHSQIWRCCSIGGVTLGFVRRLKSGQLPDCDCKGRH